MAASFGLREAQDDELELLIKKAEEYLPHSLSVHNLLLIGFRRKMVDRSFTKIWVPVDKTLPFFIIITGIVLKPNRNNLTPFWNPEEFSLDDAKTLLKSLPNWDWESPVIFNATSLITIRQVEEIILGSDGLGGDKLTIGYREDGHAYKLAEESKVENMTISDKEAIIAPISERFLPIIHDTWKYRYNETLEGIRGYMKHLPTMAAYVKDIKDNSDTNLQNGSSPTDASEDEILKLGYKPVSWVLCRYYGEIGFTYTDPEYRNRGFAALVTLALAKKLIALDISPYVNICGYNPPAVKSHERIGFQRYCPVAYHVYVTEGMNFTDF